MFRRAPLFRSLAVAVAVAVVACGPVTPAFGLTLDGESATYGSLTGTEVTMAGRSELHLTGGGDPISGSVIHLESEDAWVFFHAVVPSAAVSSLLPRVRVGGAPARSGVNVRVVQYAGGSVVVPHAPEFKPLEVFSGRELSGRSRQLDQYTAYGPAELGRFADGVRSFVLKRGYTATLAREEDGTGFSKNYVAQDGDLVVSRLPRELDGAVRFVRVFPWRWVSKKGSCDVGADALRASWHYNWNISLDSTPNWEYVAIRQQPFWPGLDQDWERRGVNHLSGFNEPDNPVEDAYKNLSPPGSAADAVARYRDLLRTGLRVGAPAVTDGGYGWIADFMSRAEAAGIRIDYVPVHYYRSQWNNDPAAAASQLYGFLQSIHDLTGRPVWVTEFNNGANWTDNAHDPSPTENRDVIEAMVEMMDATPWVERYAVYSRVEWFRQTHYDDGSPTPMGAMYRSHESPIAHVQVVPDDGVGAGADYPFDGDVRDRSGNGNNPVVYGTPRFVSGRDGTALEFDGTDDFLALPASVGDSDDFSFAAWVRWDGGAPWQRVFDLGDGTGDYLFLTPRSGSDTLRFAIRQGGGTEQRLEAPALRAGVWTHVAVTLSGGGGRLFVNGRQVDAGTINLDPEDLGAASNYLGRSQFDADPLFDGALDRVWFSAAAMGSEQVAAAARSSPPSFAGGGPVQLGAARPGSVFTGSLASSVDPGDAGGALTFRKLAGPAWLAVAGDGSLTGVPSLGDSGTDQLLVRVTGSTGLSATGSAVVSVARDLGLVVRYPFDGTVDAAAGGAHGVAAGGPRFATGQSGTGSAIDLDGSNDYIELPGGIASSDEITVAVWVRWDGGARWQRVFDFGNGTGEYLFLTPRSSSDTLRFGIRQGDVETELDAPGLSVGQWTHVAVALGGGTARLYVDGELVDSGAATLRPSDILPWSNFIGKSQWPDPLFDGRLDELLVFDRALDGAEVAGLVSAVPPRFVDGVIAKPMASPGVGYADTIEAAASGEGVRYSKERGPRWLTVDASGRLSGTPGAADAGTNRFVVRATGDGGLADEAELRIVVSPPPELLAHYEFDGGVSDSAGTAHGSTSGAPRYGDGVFDRAIEFDGSNDYVTLPAGVANGLADATFAVRFRWDGGGSWQRVFDFGNGTGSYLFLTPSSASGTLRFAITGGGGEQRLETRAPEIGEWTHVAVTLAGDTGTLYVNGAAADSGVVSLDPSDTRPVRSYLGDSQFTADPLFDGAIDDFRVFGRALGPAEVAELAVPPGPVVDLDPYASWALGIPFPDGTAGPGSDPDGDLLANVFEFLFGTDPLSPTPEPLPAAELVAGPELGLPEGEAFLAVTARLRVDRGGVAVSAEAASSLEGLAGAAAAARARELVPAVPDGEFELVTFYDAVPIAAGGAAFIRLRATVE